MTDVQSAPITFDEFMCLPDPASGHLELHNGEVVTVPPRTYFHARLQQVLSLLIQPHIEGKAFLIVELPFRTAGREAWQADLGIVIDERSRVVEPYLAGSPDWVIEVLSPGNTVMEMNQKIDVCMANGCLCFWVVDPRRQTVSVTEARKDEGYLTRHFVVSQSVPLPSPLEGTIPVAAIFEG
jgi:Uma2 family endonuclease